VKGYHGGGFRDLTILKNFHHRPNAYNYHQVLSHAVRRLCVGSESELRRPRFVAVTTYRCRVRFRRPFKINKGLFKPPVLQVRFTNAPAIFKRKINSILREHLDKFIIAYLNNIIIYSDTKKEYKKHIKWVLKTLSKENIPIAIKKCKFYTKKTDFIKFIVELKQISIELKKIKAIID